MLVKQNPVVKTNAPKSGYNPRKIRRCVRRQDETPAGQIIHLTKSFTSDEVTYHPTVDVNTGYVECDCKDFEFRSSKHNPHILSTPTHLCKHSIDAILGCVRRGELELPKTQITALKQERFRKAGFTKQETKPAERRCSLCGHTGQTFEMSDEHGRPIAGEVICLDCAQACSQASAPKTATPVVDYLTMFED